MPSTKKRRVFPFTAVIGQEEMKLALLLNVIDPRIGGVMIMGDRGTGKSTTIRACLLYTSPSPRDKRQSRMPSSA